jgi:hypothetical protein
MFEKSSDLDDRWSARARAEHTRMFATVLHEFTLSDLQARFAEVVQLADAAEYLRGLDNLAGQ